MADRDAKTFFGSQPNSAVISRSATSDQWAAAAAIWPQGLEAASVVSLGSLESFLTLMVCGK